MTTATIGLDSHRNRGVLSRSGLKYVETINAVLDDMSAYWPLTLRQVYYRLVSDLVIPNEQREYLKLSRTLTKARLEGHVSWHAIEDRSRSSKTWTGWSDAEGFIRGEMSNLLQGYRRDLSQDQDVALEVWIEKDALSEICFAVAKQYYVPVYVAKGFGSMSYENACRDRILENAGCGQRTVILYFGDCDPSGWEMLPSKLVTLQEEMDLGDQVEGIRCALTPQQVIDHNLPRSLDAIKPKDTRTPKYRAMLRENGYPDDLAVELDALPPEVLETMVREAIEENFDMSIFREQEQKQEEDRGTITDKREQVLDLLHPGRGKWVGDEWIDDDDEEDDD